MNEGKIRKIQILTDRQTELPLFYCHFEDIGHNPVLSLEKSNNLVLIFARKMLYKVKINPQRKNRVDIYMAVSEARHLGAALVEIAASQRSTEWRISKANPHASVQGNMRLPNIVWARSSKYIRAGARTASGVLMRSHEGYINVDLEFPHQTHIKMREHEVHIGVTLAPPTGTHDRSKTFLVNVPEHELQKGRNENNPISKIHGDFFVELLADVASGLGKLLRDFEDPEVIGVS